MKIIFIIILTFISITTTFYTGSAFISNSNKTISTASAAALCNTNISKQAAGNSCNTKLTLSYLSLTLFIISTIISFDLLAYDLFYLYNKTLTKLIG